MGRTDGAPDREIFDCDEALDIAGGDRDLLDELISLILRNLPEQVAQLRTGIRTADTQIVTQIAHKIRGSLGNLSARRAAADALRLEMIGRAGTLAEAEEAFARLEGDLRCLETALRAFQRTGSSPSS